MNTLGIIMGTCICIVLTAISGLSITKIVYAIKTKGESLRPRGEEDNKEKGGAKEE